MTTRNESKDGGAVSGGFAAPPPIKDAPDAVFVEVIRSIWFHNERIDAGSNPVALPRDAAALLVKSGAVKYV